MKFYHLDCILDIEFYGNQIWIKKSMHLSLFLYHRFKKILIFYADLEINCNYYSVATILNK